VPFCKRALRALYALANSNRSAPPSVSRALAYLAGIPLLVGVKLLADLEAEVLYSL
jgi:hypothetical protein